MFDIVNDKRACSQSLGNEANVTLNKLWSNVAVTFRSPPSMTNRSLKMRQLFADCHFTRLADAGYEATGIRIPAMRPDLLESRVPHDIVATWPDCVRWTESATLGPEPATLPARRRKIGATAPVRVCGERTREFVWVH